MNYVEMLALAAVVGAVGAVLLAVGSYVLVVRRRQRDEWWADVVRQQGNDGV